MTTATTTITPFKYTEEAFSDLTFGLDNPGRCTACGAEACGCEPDAREYRCEDCGELAVYGLEELMVIGLIEITG